MVMNIDTIWKLLLELNKKVRNQNDIKFINIIYKKKDKSFDFLINEDEPKAIILIDLVGLDKITSKVHIKSIEPFLFQVYNAELLDNSVIQFLELYFPYVLLPYYSKRLNHIFTISHFAQTLDGRIASSSGDSKWIGNDQNLIHSHRMRALCDAILVGSGTVMTDNPRLNVRHIEGKNPRIVIVGSKCFNSNNYNVFDNNPIIISEDKKEASNNYCVINLIKSTGEYNTKEMLSALYDKGIYSVYIEGGSNTTSCFLKQKTIDHLQIHISPKILGSGLSGFSFDGIDDMDGAIEFYNTRFIPVGNHIMFLGELK